MIVSAVLFDFDGTLTCPHEIDFAALRRELGCAVEQPILEFIDGLEGEDARRVAEEILYEREMEAACRARPNQDAEDVVRALDEMGLPLANVTRNIRPAVKRALENFSRIATEDFRIIVTRNDVVRPKPDPEAVSRVAEMLDVELAEILCVGDYVYDVELARNAGCPSVFLTNGEGRADVDSDFRIARLSELLEIVRCERKQS